MADKIISSTLSKGTSSQVKSVWGVPLQSQDQAPSLSDVMSEQMATDLQEKEDKSELKKIVAHIRETEGTVDPFHFPILQTRKIINFLLLIGAFDFFLVLKPLLYQCIHIQFD